MVYEGRDWMQQDQDRIE